MLNSLVRQLSLVQPPPYESVSRSKCGRLGATGNRAITLSYKLVAPVTRTKKSGKGPPSKPGESDGQFIVSADAPREHTLTAVGPRGQAERRTSERAVFEAIWRRAISRYRSPCAVGRPTKTISFSNSARLATRCQLVRGITVVGSVSSPRCLVVLLAASRGTRLSSAKGSTDADGRPWKDHFVQPVPGTPVVLRRASPIREDLD